MKKVTTDNYMKDRLYPRLVRVVSEILAQKDVVTPIEVFVRLELLKPSMVEDWRFNRIPSLEKVIQCNLSKASRILRVLDCIVVHAGEPRQGSAQSPALHQRPGGRRIQVHGGRQVPDGQNAGRRGRSLAGVAGRRRGHGQGNDREGKLIAELSFQESTGGVTQQCGRPLLFPVDGCGKAAKSARGREIGDVPTSPNPAPAEHKIGP